MLLPVQVTFRNVPEEPRLREYVEKEALKLERFYNRISSCRVMLERPQKAPSSKLYHVRIDLGLPGGELVVKHTPSLHGELVDTKHPESRREAENVLLHKNPRRAIHEAFQEMGRRLQDYARRQEGAVKSDQPMEEGIVKDIFPDAGYGYLEGQDGRAVYFNQASVLGGRFGRLRIGTRAAFAEEMGEKGPQASTVRIIHPRKQARSAASVGALPRRTGASRIGR